MAQRFRTAGEAGLVDRREENGPRKLDERYLGTLYEVVRSDPPDHGWRRPTWTRELLVEAVRQKTGVRVHVATMSVALHRLGARRGRPKPTVGCPWSRPAQSRRLRAIRDLVGQLPPDEVAVWEGEVDIHLNPKIGLDWMVRGQQKEVPTPGQNVSCVSRATGPRWVASAPAFTSVPAVRSWPFGSARPRSAPAKS